MLSHEEDRHLRAIEQYFETDDPELAHMFRTQEEPTRLHQRQVSRVAVDLAGGLVFTIGALTATGVLIVLGTMLITIGICLHLVARTS